MVNVRIAVNVPLHAAARDDDVCCRMATITISMPIVSKKREWTANFIGGDEIGNALQDVQNEINKYEATRAPLMRGTGEHHENRINPHRVPARRVRAPTAD